MQMEKLLIDPKNVIVIIIVGNCKEVMTIRIDKAKPNELLIESFETESVECHKLAVSNPMTDFNIVIILY